MPQTAERVAERWRLTRHELDAFALRSHQRAVEATKNGFFADEIVDAGHRWADRINAQVPLTIRLSKVVFHAPRAAHPFVDDLAQAVLFETDEKVERMTAFLERKKK
jgi:enoyl-CoA hydratase